MILDHEVRTYVKDTYGDCSPESFEKLAKDLADEVHIVHCFVPIRDEFDNFVNIHDATKNEEVRAYRLESPVVNIPKGSDLIRGIPSELLYQSVLILDENSVVLGSKLL